MTYTQDAPARNWTFYIFGCDVSTARGIDVAAANMYPLNARFVTVGHQPSSFDDNTYRVRGYIQLRKKQRLSALVRLIPNVVWEKASGLPREHISRISTYFGIHTRGEPKEMHRVLPVKRADVDAFIHSVRVDQITDGAMLQDRHPLLCTRFPRFVREYTSQACETVALSVDQVYGWNVNAHSQLRGSNCIPIIPFIINEIGDVLAIRSHHQYFFIGPGMDLDMV